MSAEKLKNLREKLAATLSTALGPKLKRVVKSAWSLVAFLPKLLIRAVRGVFGFFIGLFSGVTAIVVPIVLFVVGVSAGYFVDLTKVGEMATAQFNRIAGSPSSAPPPAAKPSATPSAEPETKPAEQTSSASPTETPPPAGGTGEPASNTNPDLNIDAQGLSRATVELRTTHGVVKFKFYSQDAPKTVDRMVQLINQGFYKNLKFHRVVPGFVVQGGDPRGDGTGGSGTTIPAEFNSRKHIEGAVAMARAADPNSADSQFYICLGRFPHLDGQYTIFGQVIYGMDVVKKIQVGDEILGMRIE